MAYDIKKTDGSTLVVIPSNTVVPPGSVLDLTLYGKGKLDYGEQWNENFVHLVENFANTTEPPAPIEGQLWFDQTGNELKLRVGAAWSTLITSGAGASTFVNVTGDTMTGDLEFPIPSSGLPADSPGLLWTGNTDMARMYVEESTPEVSQFVISVEDNASDGISFRQSLTSDTYPVETLHLGRTGAGAPGIMWMTGNDGSGPTGGSYQTIVFNEGGGDVTTSPDIRFHQSGLLAAGNNMHFCIDDGITSTIPGTSEFSFRKGAANTPGSTEIAYIQNDGELNFALDAPVGGVGNANWFLGAGGVAGAANIIDLGSTNSNINTARFINRSSIAAMRVKGANAVNSDEFTTKSQVESLISTATSSAVEGVTSATDTTYTGAGQLVTWNHNLGKIPFSVQVLGVCITSDNGYTGGVDVIDLSAVLHSWNRDTGDGDGNDLGVGFALWYNGTNQLQLRVGQDGIGYPRKSDGWIRSGNGLLRLTTGRWRFRFQAIG